MVILCVVLLLTGCTTVGSVRTVGKGNVGMEASVGGPLLKNLGPPVPVPNLFVGGRVGLLDTVDASVVGNVTAPIIPGLALDLITSVHWVPIQPGIGVQGSTPHRGWSLATAVSYHWLSDLETGMVVIPAWEVATGWRTGWFNPYVGASLAFNFYRPFDRGPVALLCPFVGMDVILSHRVSLGIRITMFDIAYNYHGSQIEWVYLYDASADKRQRAPIGITVGIGWTPKSRSSHRHPGVVL